MDYIKYKYADLHNSIYILAYIADVCNYECSYCYNKKPRTHKLLSLSSLDMFIDKLYQQIHKSIVVDLIGGEPTLHPDLLQFVNKKHDRKTTYLIYSNFSRDTEYYKQLLQNSNVQLFLSWHSKNMQFVEKLQQLKLYSQQISVSVMYEFGYTDLSLKVFNECKLLASKCCLTLINSNISKYTEVEQKIYQTMQHIDDNDYELNLDGNVMKISEEMLVNSNLASFYHWLCEAGNTYLYIDFTGDVYPCQNYITNGERQCMFNINDISKYMQLPLHKTLCKFKTCECGFIAYKYNMFKK